MSLSQTSTLLPELTQGQFPDARISLLDRSLPISSTSLERPDSAEPSDSEHAVHPARNERAGLYQRLTDNSLSLPDNVRREIVKQRYAKFGQDRYDACSAGHELKLDSSISTPLGVAGTDAQSNYFARAQEKAKAYWNRSRTLGRGRDEADTIVDVLYENQRGVFFFGIPKYSANSLLPSDPKPWQNSQFRTSAVDIRNAQVPDPSWEWVWKSWYVDMSRDVDEEGWEYSFAFVGRGSRTFAWHGNHPWFHSFVRRRRWLRMRKRRDLNIHHTHVKGHELTADYFTIHAKTLRPESVFSSQARSGGLNNQASREKEPVFDVSQMDVSTIGDLFLALRVASVDREKLIAVSKFVDQSGDELVYLGKHIAEVMSMFMFQSSRRLMVKALRARHEQAVKDLEDAKTEHQTQQKQEFNEQRTRDLLDVIDLAEKQVNLLEFWSDIKEAREGHEASSMSTPAFENKQSASEGLPKLHQHPEHGSKVPNPGSTRTRSDLGLSDETVRRDSGDGVRLERFVTASETSSDIRRREKGKGPATPRGT